MDDLDHMHPAHDDTIDYVEFPDDYQIALTRPVSFVLVNMPSGHQEWRNSMGEPVAQVAWNGDISFYRNHPWEEPADEKVNWIQEGF